MILPRFDQVKVYGFEVNGQFIPMQSGQLGGLFDQLGAGSCGTRYTIAQMQTLLRQGGFPENLIVTMAAIGMAESSGCTSIIGTIAKGREYSVGLWQINTMVHKNYTVEQLKNPATNVKEALRIYRAQGLRAWGAYVDGRYKKHVAESQKAYNGKNVPVGNVTTPGNTQVVPNNQNNQNPNPSNQQQPMEFNPAYALGFLLLLAVL